MAYIKRITDNGGDFKSGFTRQTDVLLVGHHRNDQTKAESEKLVRARKWYADAAAEGKTLSLRVIWSEWLDHSIAARRALPFADYDHSLPPEVIGGSSASTVCSM